MADRYWVGGTGDWGDDDNHWATSSGGSPANGNLPTSSDDVFVDANSDFGSGGTITLDIEAICHDFTSTSGHSYTIEAEGGAFFFCGSAALEAGLTIQGIVLVWFGTASETLTVNGATLVVGLQLSLGSGTLTLQDDLEISGYFFQSMGTFDANDHNVTATLFDFEASIGYNPTVVMGSGIWEATSDGGGLVRVSV